MFLGVPHGLCPPGDTVVSALLPHPQISHTFVKGEREGDKASTSLLLTLAFQSGPLPGEALKGWGRVAPLTLEAGQPKSTKQGEFPRPPTLSSKPRVRQSYNIHTFNICAPETKEPHPWAQRPSLEEIDGTSLTERLKTVLNLFILVDKL